MKKLIIFSIILCISNLAIAQTPMDKEKLYDFYQNQKYADAAQYLYSLNGENSTDVKVLMQMGYSYFMASNYKEAEKYYEKAFILEPKNLPNLYNLGNINNKRGNYDKAKFYYKQVAKIDSTNINVLKQLANLYPTVTDSMRVFYLTKANKLNPTEPDVAVDLAEYYTVKLKFDKAYDLLDVALKADPENIALQKFKLPLSNQLKKYNEVIIGGEQILKNQSDAGVIKEVAKAYYFTKNFSKAIDKFIALEKIAMQNESTLYYTSLCYRQLNDYPKAIEYSSKTINEAISPNISDYYALQGLIYKENNKIAFAIKSLKKGLEYANNPTILYRMATIYDTNIKDLKTAKTFYALYIKSKPDAETYKDEIKYALYRLNELSK